MEPKCKLKYIYLFIYLFIFYTPMIHKSKKQKKTTSWFKNIVIFIIWVYNWIYKLQRLDNLPLACQEALHNKIVIEYHKIIKSNDFRYCVTICAVTCFSSVFCEIRCFSFVSMLKKKRYQFLLLKKHF